MAKGAGPDPQSRKRKHSKLKQQHVPLLPPDIAEEEIEISDEDVEFVNQNKRFAGLLANLDTKSITKHVLGLKSEDGDDLERYYEKREGGKSKLQVEPTVDPGDVLPVKTLDGELHFRQSKRILDVANEKDVNQTINQVVKGDAAKVSADKLPKLSKKEQKKQKRTKRKEQKKEQKLQADSILEYQNGQEEELITGFSVGKNHEEIKCHIAELGTALLTNPEANITSLKELLDLCSNNDRRTRQVAMLSLMAIFKDIIPGYKIRLPTAKELAVQVSKEVKKIRDYESSLLGSYQAYLKVAIKASNSRSLQAVALKCLCHLLESIPHFNFRESLLAAIVPFMGSVDEENRKLSCQAVRSLFKLESKHGGEATVQAVQLIADFVKIYNCQLHPDVIEVFLTLHFDEDIGKKSRSENGNGEEGSHYNHRTKSQERRERKEKKHALAHQLKQGVEADFKEATVDMDRSECKRLQTLTLSAVFETYFRILKNALDPFKVWNNHVKPLECPITLVTDLGSHPLLGACLDGLLKFSHLISIEFLGDLLGVLRKLAVNNVPDGIEVARKAELILSVQERMQCCIAALKIVRNNMDALNVDLKDFYIEYYKILLQSSLPRGQQEAIFATALQVILCEGRHHDMQRIAGFLKRLASLALHLPTGASISSLSTVQHLLGKHKQCRRMLENEIGGIALGSGISVFQPESVDPDLSGAFNTLLWELCLLSKHYHPAIQKMSTQIGDMASSEASVYPILQPTVAAAMYSTDNGGFRPPVKLPSKFKRRNIYRVPRSQVDAASLKVSIILESEPDAPSQSFKSYFKLLKAIKANEGLRKEVYRLQSSLSLYRIFKKEKRSRKKK